MRQLRAWPIWILSNNGEFNLAGHWDKRQGWFCLAVRVLQRTYFLAVLLLALANLSRAGTTTLPDSTQSLVAIGDVHGDFNDFCAILQRVGLIDEQRHWTGGKATLVQVGDLIDRGPKPREVMDLLISLEEQAADAGGRVVALLGNHEVMNLMGDLRYVTVENYTSFADSESEKRRRTAFERYLAWRSSHPQLLAELYQPVLPETEAEWMTKHPPGFIEQRDAFSPKGIYGKWIRQRSALAKIGGVIFLHGGISPTLISLKLDEINVRIRSEIQQYDEDRQGLTDENVLLPFFTLQEAVAVAQAELIAERKSRTPSNQVRQAKILEFLEFSSWLCVREDGPLWFRGYDQWSEEEGLPQVEKILGGYNATNIVVGHTVQRTAHIRSRFGGKAMLIDTGMLSSYYPGGKASALEINDDGRFTAVYLDQQVVLLEGKSAKSVPSNIQ
jgi:Calcineurin-like phosphoesterase